MTDSSSLVWVLTVAIVAAVSVLAIGRALHVHRLTRMRQLNHNSDTQGFISSFTEGGVPEELLTNTYEYMQSYMGEQVPVQRSDNLGQVYGMAEEDLDDAVLYLAETSGYQRPSSADVRDRPPVRTVDDLVRLIASLARVSG